MAKGNFANGVMITTFVVLTGYLAWSVAAQNPKVERPNQAGFFNAVCPVGSIIPFVGDLEQIPENWQLCNGGDIKDSALATLKKSLNGKVPNFVGRVPRGTEENQKLADLGGSDMVAAHSTNSAGAHTHTIATHTHTLPPMTGEIAKAGVEIPKDSRYSVRDDNKGWQTNEKDGGNSVHIRVESPGDDEGQHRHKLGDATGGSGELTTSEGGGHAHEINAVKFIPSHIAVNYIIRIK
jgi:hypothetical protein